MSLKFDKLLAKGKAKLSEFTGQPSGSQQQQGYPGQQPPQGYQQSPPGYQQPPQGYQQPPQGYAPPNPGQYSGGQYPPQYPPQNQYQQPPPNQQWGAPQQQPQQWGPPPPQQQPFAPPVPQGSKPQTPQPGSPPPIPQNRPQSAQPPPPQNIPPPQAEKVYWKPSFAITTPVSQNFRHEIGDHGWGNNEKQMYTNDPANSFHHDNRLIVRALVQNGSYTSARLTSHQTLSRPRGYLTATYPFKWPTDGEIDLAESWNGETENHSCLHWGSYTGEDAQKHRVVKTHLPDLPRQPHTYGFAWIEEEGIPGWRGRMIWYIDGKPVMKGTIPEGTRRMEDFRILINIAMGGTVNQGKLPADGYYDFVISDLKMCEEPQGGWQQFEHAWSCTPEGKAL
ncbi:hypothetical protein HRS9122_04216 [Pyrenophora teres f. teres]|nr:hypothetical protein HRS9122_04216 [Pyrenophora teres f. teres]